MTPRVLTLHVGRAEPLRGKPDGSSAIRKVSQDGPLALGELGFANDQQIDKRYHGGPTRALCAYSREYYPLWIKLTGNDMPFGSFGENISTEGATDDTVCIGDEYELGTARVMITCPRGPCGTLSAHWGDRNLGNAVREARKSGFYLSTTLSGTVRPGDEMRLIKRPNPAWNLVRIWEVMEADERGTGLLREMAGLSGLAPDWVQRAKRRLNA